MNQRRNLLLALAASGAAAAPRAGRAEGLQQVLVSASQPADIRAFGARCDGLTDDSAAIAQAAAAGAVVFPKGATRIGQHLSIGAYTSAAPGARIDVAAGAKVSFQAGFDAPIGQVFVGQGDVTFNPAAFTTGHPEWWGARNGDPAFDSAPAINACIAACPVTELAAGAYFVGQRITVSIDNRTVRGRGASQHPYLQRLSKLSPHATQIVLTSPAAYGILVGFDQTSPPPRLLEFVTLEDFVVVRATGQVPLGVAGAAPIANPASGILPCPTGIAFKWIVNGHFNRVMTMEHSIGFYIFGCVESYWNNCSALRATAGANSGNDNWSGFYLDYRAKSGYAGGNASIYLTECRAFSGTGQGQGATSYTAGITSVDGFVDLFITRFESGLTFYGIDLEGSGYGASDFHTEDLHLVDCILDSPVKAGLRIHKAGPNTAVEINGLYCGLASDCGACGVLLEDVGGMVSLNGAQLIGGGANGVGLQAKNVAIITTSGNISTNIANPVTLDNVQYSKVNQAVHATAGGFGSNPGVSLLNCQRCSIDLSLSGVGNAYGCAVSLDVASQYNKIDTTMVEPSAVGGAGNKIHLDSRPWGGGASFGVGNIATGVLD